MPELRFRVSHLEAYRRWLEDEESCIPQLLTDIYGTEETEAQRRGTAFHKALEMAVEGERDEVEANGYLFLFPGDCEIELAPVRELRSGKNYGGLHVSGRVDGIYGRTIKDYKTTINAFEPERYFRSYQPRYYMDIFKADLFQWNIFEMNEVESRVYAIRSVHKLEQYRYPDMQADCERLAGKFQSFILGAMEQCGLSGNAIVEAE